MVIVVVVLVLLGVRGFLLKGSCWLCRISRAPGFSKSPTKQFSVTVFVVGVVVTSTVAVVVVVVLVVDVVVIVVVVVAIGGSGGVSRSSNFFVPVFAHAVVACIANS